jgi:hypothetical protein
MPVFTESPPEKTLPQSPKTAAACKILTARNRRRLQILTAKKPAPIPRFLISPLRIRYDRSAVRPLSAEIETAYPPFRSKIRICPLEQNFHAAKIPASRPTVPPGKPRRSRKVFYLRNIFLKKVFLKAGRPPYKILTAKLRR